MTISFHQNPLNHPDKVRKYPIKHDDTGKSARSRAFAFFDKGMRPSKVAPEIGISPNTAFRYYQEWKKRPGSNLGKYARIHAILTTDRSPSIKMIANLLSLPHEQLKEMLQEPWWISPLVKAFTRSPKAKISYRQHARLLASLRFVGIFEKKGISPERQRELLKEVIQAELVRNKRLEKRGIQGRSPVP